MNISALPFYQLDKLQIPLVNEFYKQVYKKGVAKRSEQVFVLRDQKILCAARLKEVQGALLLTGVACLPAMRGQGLASLLINKLLNLQTEMIYCFPYPDLQGFYEKLGFKLYQQVKLPEALAMQYQAYNKRKPLLCMAYDSNKDNKSE